MEALRSFVLVFLFSFLFLLVPLLAQAAAFDYGYNAIRDLRELRDLAIAPIELKHDVELHQLREQRLALEKERLACTTFDCAAEVRERMKPIDADLEIAELAKGEEIASAELPYEQRARELLLKVYFLTLTESLEANPAVQHLLTKGIGNCGKVATKTFTYVPLGGPHLCREVRLDFKHGEKFVRLNLAAGTVRKHFTWDGNYQPSLGSTGLAEVERILTTPGWLERYTQPEKFALGAGRRTSFYRTGGYMLGGTDDLGIAVTAREER